MRYSIDTNTAPRPANAFAQGAVRGPLLQVSGQGPVDIESGEFVGLGDAAVQTRRTLENIEAILVAGGATFADALQVRVYLTSRDDFAAMNAAYNEFVLERVAADALPARTTVMTGLPFEGMLVEIDVLAVLTQN